MLKRLFTSGTRIKLLKLFLLNSDEEYFIRELTRKLDEQINSIRRELDNLKKIGLLKSKTKNRKKFYIVDKNFIAYHELRGIIVKAMSDKDELAKKLARCGEVDFLVFSGRFVDEESDVDLLLAGTVDKPRLEEILNKEVESDQPLRYSILAKEEFIYRLKCKDRFLKGILNGRRNLVAINKLGISIK